jgi:hypothetical protein
MNTPSYESSAALNYELFEEEIVLSPDIGLDELFENRSYWESLPKYRVSEDTRNCRGVMGEAFYIIPEEFEKAYEDFSTQTQISKKKGFVIGISEKSRLLYLPFRELIEDDGEEIEVVFDKRNKKASKGTVKNSPEYIDYLCRLEIDLPRLVYIKNFSRWSWLEDDLKAVGREGLFKAARRFQEESGYQFKTYAQHAIRREMFRKLLEIRNQVRASEEAAITAHKVEVFNAKFRRRNLEEPKIEDVMKRFKCDEARARELLDLIYRQDGSLNEPLIRGDENSEPRVNVIPANDSFVKETDLDNVWMAEQIIATIRRALHIKSKANGSPEFIPRQMDIFMDCMGVDESGRLKRELNFPGAGREYGSSKQACDQIVKRVIGFVRDYVAREFREELEEFYPQYLEGLQALEDSEG